MSESKKDILSTTDSAVVQEWLRTQPDHSLSLIAQECGAQEISEKPDQARDQLRVEVTPLVEGHVGGMGDVTRMYVWFTGEESRPAEATPFVMKIVVPGRLWISKMHGLTREVEVYKRQLLSSNEKELVGDVIDGVRVFVFNSVTPTVYAADSDPESGAKRVIMKDLSKECLESGYFVGASHTPLNAAKNVDEVLVKTYGDVSKAPSQAEVMKRSFVQAARIHAHHWNAPALLDNTWLRNADFYKDAVNGETENARYDQTCQYLINKWVNEVRPSLSQDPDCENYYIADDTVRWSKLLVGLIDVSLSPERTSWLSYATHLLKRPYTFIHGDFHPGNMMVRTKDGEVVLLDLELVGIGSGPQDPAQYVMSHVSPAHFQEVVDTALRAYYDELHSTWAVIDEGDEDKRKAREEYDFEKCLQDYVVGGLGKWLWLMVVMSKGKAAAILPPKMMGYFVEQVSCELLLEAFLLPL